jgi:hypothetical protein
VPGDSSCQIRHRFVLLSGTRSSSHGKGSRPLLFQSVCGALIRNDQPAPVDLIFVLAGRFERKRYGLALFREGLAPRIIQSVGRFEVRKMAQLELRIDPALLSLAQATPPEQRHFFVDLERGRARALVAPDAPRGTFQELASLGKYLGAAPIHALAMVSTSIHLRRVSWCCRALKFFQNKTILYLPVPEEWSSFRCQGWWLRPDHWSYVASEYLKLYLYPLRHRG